MNLVERFRYLMKLNQLNASAFADEIGVQRSSVSHILSGRNKPSLEFIQKVIKRYPKVDAAWLISGATSNQEPTRVDNEQLNPEKPETAPEVETVAKKEVEEKVLVDKPFNIKSIKRIVVYYTDGTFEEFTS
ncbi:MAG: helix-turn-helix transcriptional regulator [Vicingaceae bacterium]